MAKSAGSPFKGTVLRMDASGATVASSMTTIAEVTGFDGPGLTRRMIEFTNTDSASDRAEYKRGVHDVGEITVDMNFLPANATQKLLTTAIQATISTTVPCFAMVFTDAASTTWVFSGEPTAYSPSGSMGDKLAASCTIQADGYTLSIG